MDTHTSPVPSGDQPVNRPSNRKVLRKDLWARNIKKAKRATGAPYINVKGNLVPSRQPGLPCDCKNGCFERISGFKETVLDQFNSLADKALQDTYLSSLITSRAPKRRRVRLDPQKAPRISSNKYIIRNGLNRIPVCRKAFAAVHGITLGRVALLVKKLNINGTTKDNRGTHANRPNRISEEVVKLVHDHIASFPCDPSHYSRSKNMGCQYLSPQLNTKKMHELFKQKHPEVALCSDFYYRYFKNNFNLRFEKPKSDTCGTCETMRKDLGSTMLTGEDRTALEEKKKIHQEMAATFFTDLKDKFKLAKERADVESVCFDYQQNMPLPKSPAGEVFYKRQLWVFNFGISSGKNDLHHFYSYDESVGRKSSNEPISFLSHYIENIISPDVKILYIFSDNCVSQNKNYGLLEYLYYLVESGRFEKIVHRYPEPGHSFMPCDRAFGLIEKNLRKAERISLPSDYHRIINETSKKFTSVPVAREMINNWVDCLKSFFPNAPKVIIIGKKRPKKFLITTYRVFEFTKDDALTGLIKAQKSTDASIATVNMYPINGGVNLNQLNQCYPEALKLKHLKYKDVMALAKNYVGNAELNFYRMLRSEQGDGDQILV